MPEFILDHGSPEASREFNKLDSFTQGYIQALFFTDEEHLCEESEGDHEMPSVAFNMATMESRFVGGNSVSFADLAPETLARIIEDCQRFQTANADLIQRACDHDFRYTDESAGMDFWYSRNGHGVGFWDRGLGDVGDALHKAAQAFGGVDTGLGDDGKIYF